jgi:hypothetical protein
MPRIPGPADDANAPVAPSLDPQVPGDLPQLTDEQVSTLAQSLGFDPAAMSADDRALLADMERVRFEQTGSLSLNDLLDSPPESNPLIPDATADDFAATAEPQQADVDGGIGPTGASASEASEPTGEGASDDTATPPLFGVVPGLASPLPPPLPAQPEPQATIDLGNGMVVPVDVARQIIAERLGGQQFPPQPQPTFPQPPAPTPTFPGGIDPDAYMDQQAAADIARANMTIEQLQASQREIADILAQRQQMDMMNGLNVGVQNYVTARGLDEAQRDALVDNVTRMGIFPMYLQMYQGDPRSAIEASLEAAYWMDPTYREREIQKLLAAERASTDAVEEKKAAAGALVTSPGSAPRTAPTTPRNREEADAGLVSAIAAAMNNGTGN